jgi:hypothetical protein
MSKHVSISAQEAADRLSIRELVEACAHCADRRDAQGQSTILSLTAERGTGEAYCLAHHLTVGEAKRRLMIAALRYYDTFVKMNGAWLLAERKLYVDWLEERVLS